jgi:hypothetical protein
MVQQFTHYDWVHIRRGQNPPSALRLDEYFVRLVGHPAIDNFPPFAGWDATKATESLPKPRMASRRAIHPACCTRGTRAWVVGHGRMSICICEPASNATSRGARPRGAPRSVWAAGQDAAVREARGRAARTDTAAARSIAKRQTYGARDRPAPLAIRLASLHTRVRTLHGAECAARRAIAHTVCDGGIRGRAIGGLHNSTVGRSPIRGGCLYVWRPLGPRTSPRLGAA